MTEATARFALPFILPGQAQKELFHNEALARIDVALNPAVEGAPAAAPPTAPADGQCWIAAPAATGAWAGRDGHIAAWTGGGWRFVAPQPGMRAWNKAIGRWLLFDGDGWSDGPVPVSGVSVGGQQVVGARQGAVASPSGGATIDIEARAAIGQIRAALMSHGLTD